MNFASVKTIFQLMMNSEPKTVDVLEFQQLQDIEDHYLEGFE